MVEAGKLPPGLGGVAGFAAHCLPVRPSLRHAVLELAFVGIVVAGRAGEIVPVIEHRRFGSSLG